MTISKTAWHTFRRECRYYAELDEACTLLTPDGEAFKLVRCELCYDFCPLLLAMEEFFNNA